MIFNWYKIFNLTEFMSTNLTSRNLTVSLEGVGESTILITSGNEVSITYEDVFLPIEFNSSNPYVRQGDDSKYAVYKDSLDDVYLGIEVPE